MTVSELVSYGIPENSIYVSVFRNRNGQSDKWLNIPDVKDQRKCLVYLSSIPSNTVKKYNLPSLNDMILKADLEAKAQKLEQTEKAQDLKAFQIASAFESALKKEYVRYAPIYAKYYPLDRQKVTDLSMEHAVRDTCVALNTARPKYKIKEIFNEYTKLPYKWINGNYDRFTQGVKEWRSGKIEVIHGFLGNKRPEVTKLTPFVVGKIEQYYMHPNQYTMAQIYELVKLEIERQGLKSISLGAINNYVNRPEVKNRLAYYRNTEYFNKKVQPFVRRYGVKMAGDLYYADGTPLQIPCWNRGMTRETRLNLYAVVDVMSGKIVGYDLAESEDRYNVLSAIKMAFHMEKVAPFELKYDNASATKTEEFNALKDALFMRGCIFTPTKKGNPKEKAQVERLFGTFQTSFQRMVDGFLGEGIRSRRDNGRINADFVDRLRKRDNLYTYESMEVIVAHLVSFYNQTKRNRKPSPSTMFADCEKKRATAIGMPDIAMLFWNHKTLKVSRGEVATTIRHADYIYEIWDNELKLSLAGQHVKVYYDENDLSTVHLFSQKGEYLCECRQKVLVHEGKAGQTDGDVKALIKQSRHAESIKTTVRNKTNEIRDRAMEAIGDDFMNMMSPFKVAKEKFNNSETNLLLNYVIDHKGIDLGRVTDFEPINTERERYEAEMKRSGRQKSPMAVKNHTISVIDLNEQ